MTTSTINSLDHRYDFVYLFDCKDGNPNGDPDMANSPRFDPETFQGLVSDVSLKRKVRDFVLRAKSESGAVESGYDIYVLQGHSLEERHKMAYEANGLKGGKAQDAADSEVDDDDGVQNTSKGKKPKKDMSQESGAIQTAKVWMCKHFFDIRTFGAVMSVKEFNCGQVRGPVQLTFARSFDQILSTPNSITRQSQTSEKDHVDKGGAGTFGIKHTVAYGLYQAHGFVNPFLAAQTGFSHADLEVLWRALINAFELDRSAARGLMSARGLIVFEHESKLGNAPAQMLFDRVKVARKEGIETPRSFQDYTVTVDETNLPAGIRIHKLI